MGEGREASNWEGAGRGGADREAAGREVAAMGLQWAPVKSDESRSGHFACNCT